MDEPSGLEVGDYYMFGYFVTDNLRSSRPRVPDSYESREGPL